MSKLIKASWLRKLRRVSQNLSVRAGIYCIVAVIGALCAVVFAPFVPKDLAELLGGEAVDQVLTILATSMLTVVTFSLSTLIAAYTVANSSAPARATLLITQDSGAQKALSTFLGAFIFSIVALVALSTKYYGAEGRVILFGFTLLVLVTVIWTIVRWIGQLTNLGRLNNVIREVERTTAKSFQRQAHFFGWRTPEPPVAPRDFVDVLADQIGLLQSIDLHALAKITKIDDVDIYLTVHAGQFIHHGLVIAKVPAHLAAQKEKIQNLKESFVLGPNRTFEDDPRFGFVVMSEIASRALSPGINDPGSAIQVLTHQAALFHQAHIACRDYQPNPDFRRLHISGVSAEDLVDDAFGAIARDGAQFVEVGILLQKSLRAVSQFPEFKEAALHQSRVAFERNEAAIEHSEDLERVRKAALF